MELNLRVPDLPLGFYPMYHAAHLYKNLKINEFHVGLRMKKTLQYSSVCVCSVLSDSLQPYVL